MMNEIGHKLVKDVSYLEREGEEERKWRERERERERRERVLKRGKDTYIYVLYIFNLT